MTNRRPPPSYRHHKARGLAVVRIEGKDHYLGPYDSPESWEEYHRLVADYLSRKDVAPSPSFQGQPISVQRLCLAYTDFAEKYYVKDGQMTAEVVCITYALRRLIKLFGSLPAVEFGPRNLKLVRDEFIRDGQVRGTVNGNVSRIKRMFRWGVENELIPVTVYQALATVAGLRKGRSDAKESRPVRVVDEIAVQAALPFMPPAVRAMVEIQLLTGCRPGEIRLMRPRDVDCSGDVWCCRPASHKTEHHSQERRIFIGPIAQAILKPWLDREPDCFCFSPKEMVAARLKEKEAKRVTPINVGNRPGTNRKKQPQRAAGDHYSRDSYRRAIERACKAAKIESWGPNRLRHTRATELRRSHGLDAAQVVLGHTEAFVTQIYAERDFQKAEQVMRVVG